MKNDDNVRKSDLWTKNKTFMVGFILVILSIAIGGIAMHGIIFDEIDDICMTEMSIKPTDCFYSHSLSWNCDKANGGDLIPLTENGSKYWTCSTLDYKVKAC